MTELKLDPVTGTETMCFVNGSSQLPTTKGLHISASACGAGKTTLISAIAKQHSTNGVLIVVATIEAANELSKKIPHAYVLHSQNLAAIESYKNNPVQLRFNDILIVTSARLIIDPVELFLDYKFDKKRRYVFIDELINFYPEPFDIPEKLTDTLTFIDKSRYHKSSHTIEATTIGSKTYYKHTYSTVEEMKAAYKKSSNRLFSGRTNALIEYKTEKMFRHVIDNGFTPIEQKILDFANDHITILFDGTADIVFGNDKRILPITGHKYNSDIEFIQFTLPIKRKNKEGFEIHSFEKYANDTLNYIVGITKSEKLLIVTWKTLDVYKNECMADKFEDAKLSYDFPRLLYDKLISMGAVKDNLQVIYRGSGQDRGSNEYRDFESLMFLGEWNLPDNITGDINSMFGCKCNFDDYKKSLLVQTICRLRIREHQGKSIKVYFSTDIDYNLMFAVQEYFKAVSDPGCKISGLSNPCQKLSKSHKGYLYDLAILEGYDSNIRDAVDNDLPYSFDITLTDLYTLIPKPRKAKDRYSSLVGYMKTYRITMNII
jgi:hypothetical protein